MYEHKICPKCSSQNIKLHEQLNHYICSECSYEFKIKRIFISYGHDENALFAENIKNDLKKRGHEIWFDIDHLKPSTDWEMFIEEGLKWTAQDLDKGYLLLIMTPHSVRRPDGFCLNEISRAIILGLKIIPIMLVDCEPPLSVARIQWIDMKDCIPLDQQRDRYLNKLQILIEALENDNLDFEGMQSYLLYYLEPLTFEAEISQHLQKFTGRKWVFNAIDEWLLNPNGGKAFWIVGNPGVGKTAIASWLSYNRSEISAVHFCKYGNSQKTDPRRAIKSIAYQLSTQLPIYREKVKQLDLKNIIEKSTNSVTLFDNLILQPLSSIFPGPEKPIIILIDALDEVTRDGNNELAAVISSEFPKTPSWLKIIVTSRPELDIEFYLQSLSPLILSTAMKENIEDLDEYLQTELKSNTQNTNSIASVIELIQKKSEGLFLYAKYVCDEISRKNLILENIEDFPQGLGGIYAQFFKRQFANIDHYNKTVRPIITVILAAMEPLEINMIRSIFNIGNEEFYSLNNTLGSLFPIQNGIVHFHHASIKDWLINRGRSGQYCLTIEDGDKILFEYCWKEFLNNPDEMSRYSLIHLPTYLINLNKANELKLLLINKKFIKAKLKAGFELSLVQDFNKSIKFAIHTLDVDTLVILFNKMNDFRSENLRISSSKYPSILTQKEIEHLIELSTNALEKMLLLLMLSIAYYKNDDELMLEKLKDALRLGPISIPTDWDPLLAYILFQLCQKKETLNYCRELIFRRQHHEENQLLAYIYNYNSSADLEGNYKNLILEYVKNDYPSYMKTVDYYFDNQNFETTSISENILGLKFEKSKQDKATDHISKKLKSLKRLAYVFEIKLKIFFLLFNRKNMMLFHYILKYPKSMQFSLKKNPVKWVSAKLIISRISSYISCLKFFSLFSSSTFIYLILHKMVSLERQYSDGLFGALMVFYLIIGFLVLLSIEKYNQTPTNYKPIYHFIFYFFLLLFLSLPLSSVLLYFAEKNISIACFNGIYLSSVLSTSLVYFIIIDFIIPSAKNWPWNEISFLVKVKTKGKKLNSFQFTKALLFQLVRDKNFPSILIVEILKLKYLSKKTHSFFIKIMNKRSFWEIVLNNCRNMESNERMSYISNLIFFNQKGFFRLKKIIRKFKIPLLFVAILVFLFYLAIECLFFYYVAKALDITLMDALNLLLLLFCYCLIVLTVKYSKNILLFFPLLIAKLHYLIYLKKKFFDLDLTSRITSSKNLNPHHVSLVTRIYEKDIQYLSENQEELSKLIGELPARLQLEWLYRIAELNRNIDFDSYLFIDLFANILTSSVKYNQNKKFEVFKKFIAFPKKDKSHLSSKIKMIETALKEKQFTSISVLNCLIKSEFIPFLILRIVLRNMEVNNARIHNFFYILSPEMRLIRKIKKNSLRIFQHGLENIEAKDFFEELIISFLPHIGEYRYGRRLIKKIFDNFLKISSNPPLNFLKPNENIKFH